MPRAIRLTITGGLAILFAAAMLTAADTAPSAIVVHQAIPVYQFGLPLEFSAVAKERIEWLTLFYRFSETSEFSARLMTPDDKGTYRAVLAADELASNRLDYYLAFSCEDRIAYLPEDVPARVFHAQGSGAAPPPAAQPQLAAPAVGATSYSVGVDGSASDWLTGSSGVLAHPRFQQTENLRLSFQTSHDQLQVAFNARLQYNSLPLGNQSEFNFADGQLTVRLGEHSLQAGNIVLAGTEMSLQPLSRRGIAYAWTSRHMGLELFTLSTQQLPGFAGLISPKSGAGLIGGILTLFFLDNALSLQATGLTGKDNPALGLNTGFATWFKSRRGDLFSLAGKASLWHNSLTLDSELALSRFDPDTTDSQPAVNDNAWRVGGRYSRGILELHASLKTIGKDFNSIGQQFVVSDRRILDTGIGLRLGKLSLNAAYQTQRDNVKNDPVVSTAKDTQVNASLSLSFSDAGSLQLGYSHSDLDLPGTILSPIAGGVKKSGYFGSLFWRPGQRASLQFSAQRDEFKGTTNPDLDGHSLTLNAGGNFQQPEYWMLGGQLGMTLARYPSTQKDARFYYAFINGDLAILRLLSLSLIAGANRSEPGAGDNQQLVNLDGGLVLRTPPAWRWALVTVSLRANWMRNWTGNVRTDEYRIYLKCDFSLEKT
jgi:hypothetical protein